MAIVVIGLNHRTAPLDVLERVDPHGDARAKALHDLRLAPEPLRGRRCCRPATAPRSTRPPSASTAPTPTSATSSARWPGWRPTSCTPTSSASTTRRRPPTCSRWPPACARPCSGESEILGQVRGAWVLAQQEGTARPRSTCCSAMRSRSASGPAPRPAIGRGTASVSQAAVEMAEERLGSLGRRQGRGRRRRRGRRGAPRSRWPARGVAELVVANRTPRARRRRWPRASAAASWPSRQLRRRARHRRRRRHVHRRRAAVIDHDLMSSVVAAPRRAPAAGRSTSPCPATSSAASPSSRASPLLDLEDLSRLGRPRSPGPAPARPTWSGRSWPRRSTATSTTRRPGRWRRSSARCTTGPSTCARPSWPASSASWPTLDAREREAVEALTRGPRRQAAPRRPPCG